MMRKFIILLIAVCLLSSCQTQKSARKAIPYVHSEIPKNSGVPKIEELVDLGGLALALGSELPDHFTDGRYSPGEWIRVKGDNLGVMSLTIDGISVPVEKYYDDDPLFRLPSGLQPLKQHRLSLKTEFGVSQTEFTSSHYIVATDTDGKKVNLVRTNMRFEGGVEEDWLELDDKMSRPMFAFISKDSQFLYVINIKDRAKQVFEDTHAYALEVFTYHLANPGLPKRVSRMSVDIASSPVDAYINEKNTILIVGKRSFLTIDASKPLTLKLQGRRKLKGNPRSVAKGKASFVDAIFLDNNTKIAALETRSNTIRVYENNAKLGFPLLDSINVLKGKSISLSVDLEKDPSDDSKFWVLESPNYRLSGSSISKLYKKIAKKEKIEAHESSVSQLQSLRIEKQKLILGEMHELPLGYAAHFVNFSLTGEALVTLTKLDFINSQDKKNKDRSTLSKVKGFIWERIAVGRVVALNTESGEYRTAASGVGIYYDLVDVPDIGPVFSLLKLGPAFSPPFVTPNWGLGIKSTGTYAKRKMNKFAVFPPYSVGFVDFQY